MNAIRNVLSPLCALFCLMACALAQVRREQRVILDNGITVLLWPVQGQDQVAMQAFYRVGFLHEPEGMTQAAHLLEHLVVRGGTGSYEPGESHGLLDRMGMVNAETLPHFTHYDYGLPAAELELALQIEAERLTSLEITGPLVLQEARLCYQETDFVERNPRTGMLKHAFMAMTQSWRHGSDTALVRGGMTDFSLDALKAFHRRGYRPDNLTLILVGGFERDSALKLIEKHFATVSPPDDEPIPPLDWSKVPPRASVSWDAEVSAVCLVFPPPEDPGDRLTLTLWGTQLQAVLQRNPAISRSTNMVGCSNWIWHVGDLPFYVYAALKPDLDPVQVEEALWQAVEDAVDSPRGLVPRQMERQAIMLHDRIAALNPAFVQTTARQIMRRGQSETDARAMVLGQSAINWGIADYAMAGEPETTAAALGSRSADELQKMLKRYFARDRMIVTTLVPHKKD